MCEVKSSWGSCLSTKAWPSVNGRLGRRRERRTRERLPNWSTSVCSTIHRCEILDESRSGWRRGGMHVSALQKEDVEVERCYTHRSFGGDDQSRRADEQQQLEKTKHSEKREGSEGERRKLSTVFSFYAVRMGGGEAQSAYGIHRISSRPPPTSPSLRWSAEQWNRSDVRAGG